MSKPRCLISACMMGINCRYDGGHTKLDRLDKLEKQFDLIPVCPETLAGLSCPRHPLEIVNGKVLNNQNEDMTEAFERGAELALQKWSEMGKPICLLQSRSPSCGKGVIYDGTFTGKKILGNGIFASQLLEQGAIVYSDLEIEQLLKKLGKPSERNID